MTVCVLCIIIMHGPAQTYLVALQRHSNTADLCRIMKCQFSEVPWGSHFRDGLLRNSILMMREEILESPLVPRCP